MPALRRVPAAALLASIALAGCPFALDPGPGQPPIGVRPSKPGPGASPDREHVDPLSSRKSPPPTAPPASASPTTSASPPSAALPAPVLGYKDLGNGMPATQVYLGDLRGLGFAADGAPVFLARYFNRLWRLERDGRLTALAGGGHPPTTAAFADQPSLAVGLGQPMLLQADGRGGWLIGEQFFDTPSAGRLTHLDAQGRLASLWVGDKGAEGRPSAAVPTADGFTFFTNGQKPMRWSVARGQPAVREQTYESATGMDGGAAATAWTSGVDGQGVLRIATVAQDFRRLLRYDPGADAFLEDGKVVNGTHDQVSVDAAGNRFIYIHRTTTLTVDPADGGPTRTIFTQLPTELASPIEGNTPVQAAALGPDGSVIIDQDGKVYRHADGQTTRIAGLDAKAALPAGAPLALRRVSGLCLLDDGRLLVSEDYPGITYARGADGAFKRDAAFDGAAVVRTGAKGRIVVLTNEGLSEQASDGSRTPLFKAPYHSPDDEFLVAADGAVYVSGFGEPGLKRITEGGQAVETIPDTPRGKVMALTQAPDGTIYGAATQSVWRLRGKAWEQAFSDQGIADGLFSGSGFLVADAKGRLFVTSTTRNKVLRWDPKGGGPEVVAGVGGKLYGGIGVEASLYHPGPLVIDRNGDLLIADLGHQQVKRVPAALL